MMRRAGGPPLTLWRTVHSVVPSWFSAELGPSTFWPVGHSGPSCSTRTGHTQGGHGTSIGSQVHGPDTSAVLEERPPAAPGADSSAAGSWEVRGPGRGQGDGRVHGRGYLLTCKEHFSLLALVELYQGTHPVSALGICPAALVCLKETTIDPTSVDQLRVVCAPAEC